MELALLLTVSKFTFRKIRKGPSVVEDEQVSVTTVASLQIATILVHGDPTLLEQWRLFYFYLIPDDDGTLIRLKRLQNQDAICFEELFERILDTWIAQLDLKQDSEERETPTIYKLVEALEQARFISAAEKLFDQFDPDTVVRITCKKPGLIRRWIKLFWPLGLILVPLLYLIVIPQTIIFSLFGSFTFAAPDYATRRKNQEFKQNESDKFNTVENENTNRETILRTEPWEETLKSDDSLAENGFYDDYARNETSIREIPRHIRLYMGLSEVIRSGQICQDVCPRSCIPCVPNPVRINSGCGSTPKVDNVNKTIIPSYNYSSPSFFGNFSLPAFTAPPANVSSFNWSSFNNGTMF